VAAKQKIIDLAFDYGCSNVARVQIKTDVHAGLNLHKQFTFSSSQSQTGHLKCFDGNDLKHAFLAANQ